MLHKMLWLGTLRMIYKGLQMELETARVSSKSRAGLWENLQSWPWQAPANSMESCPVKHLQVLPLSFIPVHSQLYTFIHSILCAQLQQTE